MSVSHKHELRKLSVQLPEGKCTIARLPDHAYEIKTFLQRFGIEYYGCGLPGAVSSVLELLLTPTRQQFNSAMRQAQYEKQNHRCALCDSELRVGEDHGDHIETLREAVAGQPQVFRLLCAECNYSRCDPGQRREAEILRSHFNLETDQFNDSPRPVPATFVASKIDNKRETCGI